MGMHGENGHDMCGQVWLYIGCETRHRFVAAPPPPPVAYPICRGLLLHTFVANAWRRYAPQKNIVAKVLVASQAILLQTYVAEWPPKPVTNPAFLIHNLKFACFLLFICVWIGFSV